MNDTKAFTACGSGYFNSLIKAMLRGFPTYVGGKKKKNSNISRSAAVFPLSVRPP